MTTIRLQDILEAKELRSRTRERMQKAHPGVCLCLSLNLPGQEKSSGRAQALFHHAVARILEDVPVAAMTSLATAAGPYAVFSAAGRAEDIKRLTARLEESSEYGRLLDIDVYDPDGNPVALPEREQGRNCFLCRRPAAVCMREKRHAERDIHSAVKAMFNDFYAQRSRRISPAAERYAALGLEALLYEAAAHPSPGLVDPLHSGSHRDMDFFTFQSSSAAIAHALARCAEAGLGHAGEPADLLPVLRRIGCEAEKNMLRATRGVNTQKGALFSLGLTLGATGLLLRREERVTPGQAADMLRRMTAGIVGRELADIERPGTAGERAYKRYGLAGIRGELEQGLPSVLKSGLPTLEAALARGESTNRALIRALVALMAVVDDTTILHRGNGVAALHTVRHKARALQESGALDRGDWQEAVWSLDAELVSANISPGGSADLLAVTWFFHRISTASHSPDHPPPLPASP